MERERGQKIERVSVPELDEILGVEFPVLNDGSVRLIDYMGSDASIVQAARVSYGKGTKKIREDRGLIRYLMRHRHTTPFEMCELKLHVRVPMDHWRQWIRHRTANVNEYSTRYSEAIDSTEITLPGEWRLQASGNRQGSGGFIAEVACAKCADTGRVSMPGTGVVHCGVSEAMEDCPDCLGRKKGGLYLSGREKELHEFAREVYEERLAQGVAREQARKDLPLSTLTTAYWKIDAHNLFHFLSLRMDSHAQKEIRAYADVIGEKIVSRWCPIAWEAFVDYRLKSMSLSRLDVEMILAARDGRESALQKLEEFGWTSPKSREREEFEGKAARLGMGIVWRPEDLVDAGDAVK